MHHRLQLIHWQVRCDPIPCADTVCIGLHHTVDPQQVNTAQKERNDSRRQRHAASQTNRRYRCAVFHLAQNPCQHIATNRINAASPCFGLKRTLNCLVDLLAGNDLCGTKACQILFRLRTPCHGSNLIAKVGQNRSRHRPNAASSTRDKHRTIARR